MNFLERKNFTMHSGEETFFKIECDYLTDEEIETFALLISKRYSFNSVHGVPRGGLRIAAALEKYKTEDRRCCLIVDDVFTTGKSMNEASSTIETYYKSRYGESYYLYGYYGVVLFARNPTPAWIKPVFQLWS